MNVDGEALRRDLSERIEGEVRFDAVSRALYSTDASVYQMMPAGVVIPRTAEDIVATLEAAGRHRCPVTMRGGGTSQSGQAVGHGLQIDTSKYYNRILEIDAHSGWCRVEPGIVLDELNAALKPHGLKFAPEVSTANRATVGGMMANNSSGTRSVIYGKTIDHVLEQRVLFTDGEIHDLKPLGPAELEEASRGDSIHATGCRTLARLGRELGPEIERRFPKVMRRVMGYNLDAFTRPDQHFDLTRIMVGSEGTLGVVLDAKLKLVELPRAKCVLLIQFNDLLDALAATPAVLEHAPSAVEVMDRFILDHTKENPALEGERRAFIEGDPGAVLCIEFYGESAGELPDRMHATETAVRRTGVGDRFVHLTDEADQARVWGLRQSSLGLSMAMKDDAKSLSFVEDTAVAPERLAEYIDRFLAIIRKHDTVAGVYAHASVGCLHVRPVVNMKTEEGVRKFTSIADEIADLVLEFGGALSGEHGDGMVRSPFIRKMFGSAIYEGFREIKAAFDPENLLNPGKIVDPPGLTENLRYGAGYETPTPPSYFDYTEHGGWGRAVEMCSGLGACRKKLTGTMCPSYMATREEKHSTRGRANVLRLAMTGHLGERGLEADGIKEVLDLCLECRACRSECPVGVDVGRFKAEYLARRWSRTGPPLATRLVGHTRGLFRLGSLTAPVSNTLAASPPVRYMNEVLFGIDRRRKPPAWSHETLEHWFWNHSGAHAHGDATDATVLLFNDTFTNYQHPGIGIAAAELIEKSGERCGLAPNLCCGRPLISQGLLDDARILAHKNTERLYPFAERNVPLVVCEPSCLSAIVEDAPDLLRGEAQRRARVVAGSAVLVDEYLLGVELDLEPGPDHILVHPHCHQKAMGRAGPTLRLLERIPGARVSALDAGCCGMAGSFGYMKDTFDVSRAIGERKLLPTARGMENGSRLVATGSSCRQQVLDLAGVRAHHPVTLLRELHR